MPLTIALIVVIGIWAAIINGNNGPIIRCSLISAFAVLLAAHVWVTTAERGVIGQPSGFDNGRIYRVASVTQFGGSNLVVLLVDDKGNVGSCTFPKPLTVLAGTLCKVGKQSNGSYALLPI